MEFLLRIKAWEAFMLLFGGQMALQILDILLRMIHSPLYLGYVTSVVSVITVAAHSAWCYMIVDAINRRLDEDLKQGISTFKVLVIVDLIISTGDVALSWFGLVDFTNFSVVDFPILISVCIGFYFCWFLSKMLVLYETNNPDGPGGDNQSYFFQFLFYPIGIWWLQPKINKMVNDGADPELDPDAPLDHHSWNRNPDN